MSDKNKEAGRRRWDGVPKEERIAHVRKMVEARTMRTIQCPNCQHEFRVQGRKTEPSFTGPPPAVDPEKFGTIISNIAGEPFHIGDTILSREVPPGPRVSVRNGELRVEKPVEPSKRPKPTDICQHGMEYQRCRVDWCKLMLKGE